MIQLDGYSIKKNLTLEDYDVSMAEGLSAVADQTWLENPTSAVSRLMELNKARPNYEPGVYGDYSPEKAFIGWNSKEEADKKVKEAGLDLKFSDSGISQEKLDILMDRKREENKRKSLISRAPQGFLPGAAKIGTSLAVSIADPLNIASAFIPIVSQKNTVRLMSSLGRNTGRAAVGAIEGIAGAAMIEPLVYYAMTEEQADYDLYDSYMNLTFGAVIGGGLHAGLGAIGDRINRAPAQTKSDLLQAATGQALDNRPIDIGRVADEWRIVDPYYPEDIEGTVRGELEDQVVDTSEVRAEIKRLNDQLEQSEIDAKAEADISRIEQGHIDREFIDSHGINGAKYKSFTQTTVPKHSSEADPLISSEYQEKINLKPPETPDTVDKEIDDIITSLEDQGVDTAEVRAEIDQTNKQIERESNGLREAVACMLG
jgi:hypothetical protein